MRIPAVVLALLLLTGCTGADEPDAAPSGSSSESSSAAPSDQPTDAPSDQPSGAPSPPATAGPGVALSEACAEVRAGIDAFNVGDYDETVERFEAAVPLAEGQADGSPASNELVEAVRWYAELPAEDYLEASLESAEFERYKAITLGQCIDGVPAGEPSEPGVDT